MSSSGLIYAVIVGAWAAYLVPMWLRRQDELNEARPTERFSTAIRLLSGRAGMERRYAKDLRARSTDEEEHGVHDPDAATDSVDVRAFAVSQTRPQTQAPLPSPPAQQPEPEPVRPPRERVDRRAPEPAAARGRVPAARRDPDARAAQAAAARARRTKALARRRRTTTLLFAAFTLGAVVAAVGGLAFLWAPGVPALLLSAYIVYLRSQERRRFAYQMDRRQAEVAAQRLRERERQPRRRPSVEDADPDEPEGPEAGITTDPGLSALAADRRALVEQTDHAEWVDQQRERQHRPGRGGDSWDPVPVPLPTYVTAPVAPRATRDVDLGAPDTWSSARSSAVPADEARAAAEEPDADASDDDGDRTDARRAASARRSRERGRTPLFDQYEDGERPKAANE
ncbi:divisome protein SepX/GlpR [Streptomyces griseoflavus]|uniref:Membrane protein n=1 Tax=Streptomyces griseoflavus Tu4000 TaxID=467200 RepID=D9XVI6_9ACTN|nr:gephyrin-like molybdotransferase receptor GlpR [Streptomyces griseoflavus]EFL40879.1 membrane protein [Streptomyces griseoflavus Tu4000]